MLIKQQVAQVIHVLREIEEAVIVDSLNELPEKDRDNMTSERYDAFLKAQRSRVRNAVLIYSSSSSMLKLNKNKKEDEDVLL